MTFTFNLLDEPWIPCITEDGQSLELGLRETLLQAHELAELRDQSPLVTAALHRLLLAVLHRALDGPRSFDEWIKIWQRKRWDKHPLDDYLAKWKDRFDLFHPKYPFYQIAGFEISGAKGKEDKTNPISKLAQEVASGNNDTLFDHTVEERRGGWAPALAARQLVAVQAFALGGGVGSTSNLFGKHPNFTHAPLIGGVSVFLRGGGLFETLALNLLVLDSAGPLRSPRDDKPNWEHKKPYPPTERTPLGYLHYLTWNVRSVRLLPELNGCQPTVIRCMYYTQGCAFPKDELRPEWPYRIDAKRGRVPVGVRAQRALWRDSAALFGAPKQKSQGETRPFVLAQAARLYEMGIIPRERQSVCFAVGVANDKAKALLWRIDELPVSGAVLNDDECAHALRLGLDCCEEVRSALRGAMGRMVRSFKESGMTAFEAGERFFWQRMEPVFRVFLANVADDPDIALSEWAQAARRTALQALEVAVDNARGRSSREMQARVEAESFLRIGLSRIQLLQRTEENS